MTSLRWEVVECEQRSPEWFAARAGRLTGSCAGDIVREGKGGKPSKMRGNLAVRLALERITGRSLEKDFVSGAMQQGMDREADAVCQYEALTGEIVRSTGFMRVTSGPLVGCSLDGHVEVGGDIVRIIECKCPTPAVHLEYLRTGAVPKEYVIQVVHNLWVTGARSCDWFSYNPDFPEALRTKLVRFDPPEDVIADYAEQALGFLREVETLATEIKALEADKGVGVF